MVKRLRLEFVAQVYSWNIHVIVSKVTAKME